MKAMSLLACNLARVGVRSIDRAATEAYGHVFSQRPTH